MNFIATATEFILWLWMYFSVLLSVLNLSIKNFYNIITVLLWVSIRSLFCNHTHFSPTTQNITPATRNDLQLHSTTRPTSATCNIRPATHIYDSTILATDITHLAEDTNTTTTIFTYTFVIPTINCHLCYICYLAFVSFIVFGSRYSHALNFKNLQGWRAYRLRNKMTSWIWSLLAFQHTLVKPNMNSSTNLIKRSPVLKNDKFLLMGYFNVHMGCNHKLWSKVIGRKSTGNYYEHGYLPLKSWGEYVLPPVQWIHFKIEVSSHCHSIDYTIALQVKVLGYHWLYHCTSGQSTGIPLIIPLHFRSKYWDTIDYTITHTKLKLLLRTLYMPQTTVVLTDATWFFYFVCIFALLQKISFYSREKINFSLLYVHGLLQWKMVVVPLM